MKNKGLKIFGGILAILIAGFLVITLSLDGIVKSGIEENGSELLQTEVVVDDIDISLLNGSGSISGFVVSNPEGFSDEPAVKIEEASIKMDLSTLLSNRIVVEEIIIQNPEFFFEQKGIGINLKTLKNNMGTSESSAGTALVIDYLLVKNGQIKVSTTIDRERTAQAGIEKFELNNIGRNGSNTVKQSVREVMEPLLERATAEAIKGGIMEQFRSKAEEMLGG